MKHLDDGLYYHQSHVRTSRIAGFDLGKTLVVTITGKTAVSDDDWTFLPNRLPVLKALQDDGYTIVIFTNQTLKFHRSDSKTKVKMKLMNLRRKNQIIKTLECYGINPWVFASTDDNRYRKPLPGMWKIFNNVFDHPIDLTRSFFVGDSAGRITDKSSNDLFFAEIVGLDFYLPDDFFQGEA